MVQQVPSSKQFVFKPTSNKSDIAGDVDAVGKVEELGSEGLMLFQIKETKANAKEAWQQVRDKLKKLGVVQPVLVDELGDPHYPTGEITVRFHETPTDDDLEKFAREHKLRLRKRNEFISKQVVFEVEDANERYLPNLVEEIGELKDVIKNAWANTLSHYKRGSKS